ncbi:hypothetical protein C5F52_14835 [Limnohabitans sp. TS-CS-82]|jgi:hypothetical protein|uniref:hypothetical protein n=1 Tax=Limnohabitans sp. TS-CS-82 TaxID=2094193 RepID=UPI000CF279B7|nr:hypothetical protein [Limnohabitans sp. TS-CS-82]PQA82296.1 hypothetical protein C5F52_14835 [Limnohabitans sp. TS-CS-82]
MSHLPPIASTPAHLEDPVISAVTSIASTAPTPSASATSQAHAPSVIAVSFAFDSIEKTLNVVIKDERSGEVVRTIEYTHMPADIHRSDKLNGLLLDQFV